MIERGGAGEKHTREAYGEEVKKGAMADGGEGNTAGIKGRFFKQQVREENED